MLFLYMESVLIPSVIIRMETIPSLIQLLMAGIAELLRRVKLVSTDLLLRGVNTYCC